MHVNPLLHLKENKLRALAMDQLHYHPRCRGGSD